MTHDQLRTVVDNVCSDVKALIHLKNHAYSSEEDAIDNFKLGAKEIGTTSYQTWAIYFHKQISAIFKAIRENPDCPEDKSEGLYNRIKDAIAYLIFLQALRYDDNGTLPLSDVKDSASARIEDFNHGLSDQLQCSEIVADGTNPITNEGDVGLPFTRKLNSIRYGDVSGLVSG